MLILQEVKAEEENLLHNIMQFYIYEFSKYIPVIRLESNGAYKPFDLEKYWVSDNHHAYFIKLEDELIGFALVESATESNPNSIKKFFIMAKHNGNGYGKKIACKLFNAFSGDWKITQIENNEHAHNFWHDLINEFSNGKFNERFESGEYIQEFNSEAILSKK